MDHNKEAHKKIEQIKSDYKITFGSDEGKRVLEDISKRCHEFNTTHVKGDSHESAFLEGTRFTVLFINNMLNKKPTEDKWVVKQTR